MALVESSIFVFDVNFFYDLFRRGFLLMLLPFWAFFLADVWKSGSKFL